MKKVISYKIDGYFLSNGNKFSIQMPINSEILDFREFNNNNYIFALVEDSIDYLVPYNFYAIRVGLNYDIFDTNEILKYVGLNSTGEYAIFEILSTGSY